MHDGSDRVRTPLRRSRAAYQRPVVSHTEVPVSSATTSRPTFVVLRRVRNDVWEVLGEVPRRPGLPSREARAQATMDATGGTAKRGEAYAAVLRSEWRIAQKW